MCACGGSTVPGKALAPTLTALSREESERAGPRKGQGKQQPEGSLNPLPPAAPTAKLSAAPSLTSNVPSSASVRAAPVEPTAAAHSHSVLAAAAARSPAPALHAPTVAAQAAPPLAAPLAATVGPPPLQQWPRILLVEDTAVNALLAKRMLRGAGFTNVTHVENGELAVAAVRDAPADAPFHIVLMDCAMPVLDGYEATRRIRALPDQQRSRVPIVALTASALADDVARSRDAGMDDHLPKPHTAAALLGKVRHWAKT